MRLLRETLLSLFVISVVLYLYVVAVGALLFNVCRIVFAGGHPEAAHHLKIAAT